MPNGKEDETKLAEYAKDLLDQFAVRAKTSPRFTQIGEQTAANPERVRCHFYERIEGSDYYVGSFYVDGKVRELNYTILGAQDHVWSMEYIKVRDGRVSGSIFLPPTVFYRNNLTGAIFKNIGEAIDHSEEFINSL